MTTCAAREPDGEDMAETALFANALLRHPGRIPPVDAQVIRATVPAPQVVFQDLPSDTPAAHVRGHVPVGYS